VLYADFVVWCGGSGGPVDDFFKGGGGDPNGKGQLLFLGDWTAQCND